MSVLENTSFCFESNTSEEEFTFDDIVTAVIHVESRGDNNAYNESEKAAGCLQIRPIMVREVNRNLKLMNKSIRYTLDDRWSREKSIEMFTIMSNQIPYKECLTSIEFAEQVARRWNGGTRGFKKKSTLSYWEKVKEQILD